MSGERAPVDVFLSYKHGEDTRLAREIVTRLREAGFTVFIDEDISAGEILATAVDNAIATAKVVLVLWSQSVREDPHYVLGEAMTAKENKTLVPVALDDSPVSTFFRAMRVRRVASGGLLDLRAFVDLRRDLGDRCGNRPVTTAAATTDDGGSSGGVAGGRAGQPPRSPATTTGDLPPEPRRVGVHRRTALSDPRPLTRASAGGSALKAPPPRRRGTGTGAAAVVPDSARDARRLAVHRTIRAIARPGAWPVEQAPSDVVAVSRDGELPTNEIAGLVDLTLPGVARSVLVLGADALELVGHGSTRVPYQALVREEVRMAHTGYGYTAVISAGGAELEIRGREQTALLLEVLHLLREELAWTEELRPTGASPIRRG
jgi:hypothetical protein